MRCARCLASCMSSARCWPGSRCSSCCRSLTALIYGELAPLRGFVAGAGDQPRSADCCCAWHAALPLRAEAARWLPAGYPELADARRGRDGAAADRPAGPVASPTPTSRPCRACRPPAPRCSPASIVLPHAINLWRHALSWLGGMGIIVLAVAMLPLLGVGGMQLYRADAPGPVKDAQAGTAHHRDRAHAVVWSMPA